MRQQPEMLQQYAAATRSAAATCCKIANMSNLGYWYIFTCSIDMEGYLIDPDNSMLQIAAYLQHICRK